MNQRRNAGGAEKFSSRPFSPSPPRSKNRADQGACFRPSCFKSSAKGLDDKKLLAKRFVSATRTPHFRPSVAFVRRSCAPQIFPPCGFAAYWTLSPQGVRPGPLIAPWAWDRFPVTERRRVSRDVDLRQAVVLPRLANSSPTTSEARRIARAPTASFVVPLPALSSRKPLLFDRPNFIVDNTYASVLCPGETVARQACAKDAKDSAVLIIALWQKSHTCGEFYSPPRPTSSARACTMIVSNLSLTHPTNGDGRLRRNGWLRRFL